MGATESVTLISDTEAPVPVPLTLTVTGFSSGSLEGMSKLSLDELVAFGENRAVSVQLAAGARVCPEQVSFRMVNGVARGFTCAIVPMTRLSFPALETVTVWSEEVPTVTLPKGICRSAGGATESFTAMSGTGVGEIPVPATLIVTGFSSGSLEGILKVSFAAPVAVGENRTVIVQLADGARVCPEQVSVPAGMLNGAASGFAEATVPITRLAVPALVTVTVWSEEAPTVTLPNRTWLSFAGGTESVTAMSGAAVAQSGSAPS